MYFKKQMKDFFKDGFTQNLCYFCMLNKNEKREPFLKKIWRKNKINSNRKLIGLFSNFVLDREKSNKNALTRRRWLAYFILFTPKSLNNKSIIKLFECSNCANRIVKLSDLQNYPHWQFSSIPFRGRPYMMPRNIGQFVKLKYFHQKKHWPPHRGFMYERPLRTRE